MPEYPDELFSGHLIDTNPFALDLYRLLCLVVGDKALAKLALGSREIERLQESYREIEISRILISSAIALRILLGQKPKGRPPIASRPCGQLYSNWPDKRHEPLTLQEACNKIIHTRAINHDFVLADRHDRYPEAGAYVRPFVFLYGSIGKQKWRAKLSVVEFVQYGTAVFLA
jgi:hypothetical protein